MQSPPSPIKCLRYPITTCLIVLSIAATFQSWFGTYVDPVFLSNTGNCLREPWRLLTPAFFHGGPFHLIFNVCWLWAFGTLIEAQFGHVATLGICLLLAVGSVAGELALFRCGLGLSGVVYGLFGLLWVLSRTDPRFDDAVDQKIIELMIGWFILCVVLKVADVWNIALVSHASGCILGALLGWTIGAGQLGLRLRRGAVLAVAFLLCLVGATVARPRVNLVGDDLGPTGAEEGRIAWEHHDAEGAIKSYEQAVAANPNVPDWWDSLGLAYRQIGKDNDANNAFNKAAELRRHHSIPEQWPWEQSQHGRRRPRPH